MDQNNKMRKFFTIICCSLICKAVAQYKPDFTIAPVNPVAEIHTLNAEHVKGDVYAVDGQVYDKNGIQLWSGLSGKIYEVCPYTKQQAQKFNKSYCLRDDKGRLVEKGYYKDGALSLSSYTYKNNLLIRVEHTSNIQNYEYDQKGRITKEIITYKAANDKPEKTTYSKYTYQLLDDNVLKVSIESQNQDRSISNYAYHYKDGLIIYSVHDDYEYQYKFDDQGNWIYNRFSEKDDRFGKKERSIIYYSDFVKPKFHFQPDPTIQFSNTLLPHVNGKILRGSKIELVGKMERAYLFYYLPEINYYIIPDAKAIPILDGKVSKADSKAVYNTQMAYYRNIDSKSYVVYDKGEKLKDYSHFGKNWVFLQNGDPVITVNNEPTYILKDYYQARDQELMPIIPYKGEPLKEDTALNLPSKSLPLSEKARKYVEMKSLGSYKARSLFLKEIESFKADGKTLQEIDEYYLDVFNELYDHDFEEGYEFMMLVPINIVENLMPKIDADKRSAIKTRSREELRKYNARK